MAVEFAIVNGSLGTDATPVSFTSSGFGTPDAAIVVMNGASSGSNPEASNQALALGFFDGTNQCTVGTGANARQSTDDAAAFYAINSIEYTAANTTDGITLTLSGTTIAARLCTVLLIKGLNGALVGNFVAGTSGDVTTTGVNPNFIFFAGVGASPADYLHSIGILQFGAARIDGSSNITNIGHFYSREEQDAIIDTTDSFGQFYQTANWYGRVSAFGSGQFSYTTSGSTGGDIVFYLALELPDPDDGYLGTIGTKGSTGADTAVTGLGFEPSLIGFLTSGVTADDAENSATAGFGFGFDDGTTHSGHFYSVEPGGGVDDCFYDASNSLHVRVAGSATQQGYVSAIGSDGYTMTYGTSGSVVRAVVFGFGDSNAGGSTITLSNLTFSARTATSITPRLDVTVS